jgi:hypothetical protein
MTTALTLPQRAAVALGTAEHEIRLRELALASSNIVAVLNVDAREEAHRAAMNLRNARTAITKTGKAAREDATAFSKAVILEEARLISIIEPEEERVFGLRDAWDQKVAAERQARIDAERQRVDNIKEDIQAIRNMAVTAAGKPIQVISALLELLDEMEVTEERFAEFQPEAGSAVGQAMDALTVMYHEAIAAKTEADRIKAEQEAEAARMQAEREELAKLRAEAAERHAAAQAQLKAEREQQEKELAAQRAELAHLRKLEDDQRAFQQQQEREALEQQNADMRLERARLAKQQAEMAEAQRQGEEQEAERQRLQAAADQLLADALKRESPPTPGEIVYLVAETYLVPHATAAEWLTTLDFRGFVDAPALAAA